MKDYLKEVTGFDELIFENRNKEYGAYLLRKSYNTIVIISLVAASLIGCSVVVIPFLRVLGKQHQTGSGVKMRYVQVQMDKMEPPDELIVNPPSQPPPPGTQQSVKYVAPVVVDSVLPTEKPLPTVADVQAAPPDNEQLVVTNSGEQNELIGEEVGEDIYEFFLLEVRPTFKGGDIEKFRDWVQKRTNYPQEAQDNGIQGKVTLTFIVEKDGSVSDVKVLKGVDKILDDEAIKAIQASPKWSPGLQRGRPVRVRFFIPLIFSLNR